VKLTRREFIRATALGSAALATDVSGAITPEVLPRGPTPEPLLLRHFPSRLHAFVWRNWPLVPVATLARVIGATSDQIREVAESMGLGRQPKITSEHLRRSALTIIKRNWHLLPYEQLLQLLGWTAAELAYTLREDDFLYIKLGSLKPKCEPIRYGPAADVSQIHGIVANEFRQGAREPLFGFLQSLSRSGRSTRRKTTGLRLCYSYFALYGDPLLDPKLDPYPDGYLSQLAGLGVNAVWLQGVLQKLAPFPWAPERSRDYEVRLRNLRKLAQRAAGHGVRIFVYLNEPRTLPVGFFEKHPELKGVTQGEFATLCTSHAKVQEYLAAAVTSICRAVPELGGFFTISASENLTNCWSHGQGAQCPRCGKRKASEVIAEANGLLWRGITEAQSKAELIVWDWGWADGWAEDAIRRLPEGVSFMSVSEWSLPIERGGIKSAVGEYSISAIGPGPRAKRHWAAAQKRGLRVVAKIQAGNTWELSAVPYIPALQNVGQHAANLRAGGVKDVMLGWTLGGYPSPNLEIVSRILEDDRLSVDEALQEVARRRYGDKNTVVEAWREASRAFTEFPYHIGVVYNGPMQLGPANLLWEKPTSYRATMVGFPYDDLDTWRSIYGAEVFIAQMEKVAAGFRRAAAECKSAPEEARFLEAAAIHFGSTAKQARFVQARRALSEAKNGEDAARELSRLSEVLLGEIEFAKALHRIQSSDSRIGFEASNQYYYVPEDLVEKVLNCRDLLERWIPAERAKWKLS